MLLYFAAPLFCSAELDFNINVTNKIEDIGFKVFLPQRDGDKVNKEPYINMKTEERAKEIFNMDKANIFKSDIFLFVLDGRIPDEGAAVALGIAHAHKEFVKKDRLLVGLHTDKRAAFMNEKLNPMIYSSLEYIAESVEDLINYLRIKTTI
ncbi:MAG: nucleoside 2-deoxyribosyltransferase domain-containing protein [Tepidibacter sp.]|jgi:nucleoside 2-deoxyribosyltransferase|uniref:nucleoside 2-deoxyribosyltransferase n=1 Tax=Tepidibacter sp. TaxID=2529387 RepID=UPI0025E7AA7A|nr:nucleoside 2-deoxyribosyltransferase domain-containing protein [Tepidibacter sp.]MCT4507416.1 nucleoside 2-deoxyribosyltransferase domain-containing protein [Tepidibacter sp.]